jgi:carboxymethylenebutenolidase
MVMDFILPGVAPTGRVVEMALAVVVDFEDGKIAAERIYWDQASVLVQLGLLDPAGLPVTGVEQAQTVQDPTRPRNQLLGEHVD